MPNWDQLIDRRNTGSMKWGNYEQDVIPMWVADMDFRSPEPVIQALHERVEHGVFGYTAPPAELAAVICERLARLYRWNVTPEQIVYFPGVVSTLNVICRAFGQPGDGVLVQVPVYPPFLSAPLNHGLILQTAELTPRVREHTLCYETDYDAFEAAITPQTRLFILCHPHNPIGRELEPAQLAQLAEICLRHNVLFVSDEIHGDLMLGGKQHIPPASLAPEIAERCITLMAPSKTFNLPGLGCSFAVVPQPEWRQRLARASEGIIPLINALGFTAALAAYREGGDWLAALLEYLTANRDFMVNYISDHLPSLRTTVPEATYLAWLDCRDAGLPSSPYEFFLQKARVALSDGAAFGPGGQGFVRLNFGCPRAQLAEALERMARAMSAL